MPVPAPILLALAARYERSTGGRTGSAGRDLLVSLEELLREANAAEGDARAVAEQHLREAQADGILELVPVHKRDPGFIHQIRFNPANEARLYEALGTASPSNRRQALAAQFLKAASLKVPERWQSQWTCWCERMRESALNGRSVEPFERDPGDSNARLLTLLPRLLAWQGESLVRFASCVLCGDSKSLENLAGMDRDGEFRDRLRGKLGRLLEDITEGECRTLDELGILPNPRSALIHGPLRLCLGGEWLDLGRLSGAFRLAATDMERAEHLTTAARRCITVENETSFHELAKLQSGELLIQTSFPGSGTLQLLKRLPVEMEYWHFGDSDDAGFEILRVLRDSSGRNFQPLHMQRGRIPFEQESLGHPTLRHWPFYKM